MPNLIFKTTHYDQDAEVRMIAFVEIMENPERRVDFSVSTNAEMQVQNNRKSFKSILKCIEFCGRQGMVLRGHLDDDATSDDDSCNKGNFFSSSPNQNES